MEPWENSNMFDVFKNAAKWGAEIGRVSTKKIQTMFELPSYFTTWCPKTLAKLVFHYATPGFKVMMVIYISDW